MNNTYYHFLDKKLCFLNDCYALIEKIEMSLTAHKFKVGVRVRNM